MKKWIIDPVHSEIAFRIKHLMISTVRGTIGKFEGSIEAKDDTFEDGVISFEADTQSINTKNDQRDGHLHSPDFFDVANFPKISFISKSVNKIDGNEFAVIGDLTIKGVTKSIQLKMTANGISKDMYGSTVAGFEISSKINRQDFGLSWNKAVETGGVLIGDDVAIEALIEAKEVE